MRRRLNAGKLFRVRALRTFSGSLSMKCALGAKAQSRDPGAPGVQGIRLYREKNQLLRTNITMTTTTRINTSAPPPMNMATFSFL